MKSKNLPVLLISLLIFIFTAPVWSDDTDTSLELGVSENTMAIRGDAVLTQAELDAALNRVPLKHRAAFIRDGERVDSTIGTLLTNRLIANEARKAGAENDRLAQLRMELAAEKELAEYWIGKIMDEMPDADYEALAHEKYLLNQDQYVTAEMVDVSHILISSETREEEEALALANSLKSQLDEDATLFQAFVDEYSEDPSKNSNAGHFSNVSRGQMVKPFEEQAFSMTEPGEISNPVKTSYGYHIIRLNKTIPSRQRGFNEVKPKLITLEKEAYASSYRSRYLRSLLNDETVIPEGAVEEMAKRYFGEDLSGAEMYPTD